MHYLTCDYSNVYSYNCVIQPFLRHTGYIQACYYKTMQLFPMSVYEALWHYSLAKTNTNRQH